jgi:hypothetical protein
MGKLGDETVLGYQVRLTATEPWIEAVEVYHLAEEFSCTAGSRLCLIK